MGGDEGYYWTLRGGYREKEEEKRGGSIRVKRRITGKEKRISGEG